MHSLAISIIDGTTDSTHPPIHLELNGTWWQYRSDVIISCSETYPENELSFISSSCSSIGHHLLLFQWQWVFCSMKGVEQGEIMPFFYWLMFPFFRSTNTETTFNKQKRNAEGTRVRWFHWFSIHSRSSFCPSIIHWSIIRNATCFIDWQYEILIR